TIGVAEKRGVVDGAAAPGALDTERLSVSRRDEALPDSQTVQEGLDPRRQRFTGTKVLVRRQLEQRDLQTTPRQLYPARGACRSPAHYQDIDPFAPHFMSDEVHDAFQARASCCSDHAWWCLSTAADRHGGDCLLDWTRRPGGSSAARPFGKASYGGAPS